jgi:hypothetical protein
MRYRLRTLVILTAVAPPALAVQWWFFTQPDFRQPIFVWIVIGCMDALVIFYLMVACANALSRP